MDKLRPIGMIAFLVLGILQVIWADETETGVIYDDPHFSTWGGLCNYSYHGHGEHTLAKYDSGRDTVWELVNDFRFCPGVLGQKYKHSCIGNLTLKQFDNTLTVTVNPFEVKLNGEDVDFTESDTVDVFKFRTTAKNTTKENGKPCIDINGFFKRGGKRITYAISFCVLREEAKDYFHEITVTMSEEAKGLINGLLGHYGATDKDAILRKSGFKKEVVECKKKFIKDFANSWK